MEELFRTFPGILERFPDNEAVTKAIVFAAWKRSAGELLAEHAFALSLDERRLRIGVSSEMWRRHLEDLSGQMLFRLNSILGSARVVFLEFVVISQAEISGHRKLFRPNERSRFENEAAAEITSDMRIAAGKITDLSLRENFLQAAANCLTRQRRLAEGEADGQH